jgi:hypothetical protein
MFWGSLGRGRGEDSRRVLHTILGTGRGFQEGSGRLTVEAAKFSCPEKGNALLQD